jgi:hypothetical protein
MCVCVYIYIYIYTHTHTHIHIYIFNLETFQKYFLFFFKTQSWCVAQADLKLPPASASQVQRLEVFLAFRNIYIDIYVYLYIYFFLVVLEFELRNSLDNYLLLSTVSAKDEVIITAS